MNLTYGALELLDYPYDVRLGTSLGAWQSVTSSTTSLFLDGAVVSGEGTSNREVLLRVSVSGRDRAEVVLASEALLAEANKQSNELLFVPDVGLPFVVETFRVRAPTRVDGEDEALPNMRVYELTLPALPFVRSTTRQTPEGLASSIFLDGFEGTTTWMYASANHLRAGIDTNAAGMALGGTDHYFEPGFSWVPTNATVTGDSVYGTLTASSAGTVTAQTALRTPGGTFPAGWPVGLACSVLPTSAARTVALTLEWCDATGAVLASEVETVTTSTTTLTMVTRWGAPPPTGAVRARGRISISGMGAGEVVTFSPLDAVPARAVPETLPPSGWTAVDGTMIGTALVGDMITDVGPDVTVSELDVATSVAAKEPRFFALFLRRDFATPVDISEGQKIAVYATKTIPYSGINFTAPSDARVTVVDGTGATSTFALARGVYVNQWWEFSSGMTPVATSGGGANLADIRSYRMVMHLNDYPPSAVPSAAQYAKVDSLKATFDIPGQVSTQRGTVYNLSGIVGSAPGNAEALIYGPTMTDMLTLTVPSDANPLLAVTSNTAAIAAPAPHRGVYSVIGCVSPATALSNPQVVVTQKLGTATTTTRTLTGVAQPGNHYVDFGTIELPIVPAGPDNTQVGYEFALTPASTAWTELLLVDADGSLLWIPSMTGAGYVQIDEPSPTTGVGAVWVGSQGDGSDWMAPSSAPVISRPLRVQAPSVKLLVYSTIGAPSVRLSYYPRWLVEPTS